MNFMLILSLLLLPQGTENPGYKTVRIAGMEWMTEDLDRVTFNNGDSIRFVFTQKAWEYASDHKIPAWTYYGVNGKKGILYNGYAVTDPRGLAPRGWHIPTAAEWQKLADIFNAKRSVAGLKSQSLWPQGCNGNDSMGFSAIPTGWMRYDGIPGYQGETGFWYTQTEGTGGTLQAFDIRCDPDLAGGATYDKAFGFAVRCVKNEQ